MSPDRGARASVRAGTSRTDLDAASSAPLHPAAREVFLAAVDRGYADPRRLHGAARDARLLLDNAREATAEALGVTVGDRVRITYPETGEQTVTLAGTFPQDSLLESDSLITMVDFEDNVTSRLDGVVLVTVRDGASPAAVERSLTQALMEYPNVTISDPAQLTADAQASVDQMLGLVTALLLLAVVVAVLGIVNTLVLSVVERTRELGLLRAVGATQRQIRTLVRRESVLMSVLGAVTGIALGTVSGIALSRALLDQGVTRLAVPAGTLTVYLVIAALVGVLAAIGPARRASRVDVLRAVTTE